MALTIEPSSLLQDNWVCVECSNVNYPLQRYCGKCWKIRQDWLPKHDDLDTGCRTNRYNADPSAVCAKTDMEKLKMSLSDKTKLHTDSGVGTQPSSQETVASDARSENKMYNKVAQLSKSSTHTLTVPSKCDLKESVLSLDCESATLETRYSFLNASVQSSIMSSTDECLFNTGQPSKTSSVTSVSSKAPSLALEDPCMICLSRPKTASLIHGSSGHQVCCFPCAKRLRRRGKVCPVCRRPIQKVIKNYIL